jgi:hypothetical protein
MRQATQTRPRMSRASANSSGTADSAQSSQSSWRRASSACAESARGRGTHGLRTERIKRAVGGRRDLVRGWDLRSGPVNHAAYRALRHLDRTLRMAGHSPSDARCRRSDPCDRARGVRLDRALQIRHRPIERLRQGISVRRGEPKTRNQTTRAGHSYDRNPSGGRRSWWNNVPGRPAGRSQVGRIQPKRIAGVRKRIARTRSLSLGTARWRSGQCLRPGRRSIRDGGKLLRPRVQIFARPGRRRAQEIGALIKVEGEKETTHQGNGCVDNVRPSVWSEARAPKLWRIGIFHRRNRRWRG